MRVIYMHCILLLTNALLCWRSVWFCVLPICINIETVWNIPVFNLPHPLSRQWNSGKCKVVYSRHVDLSTSSTINMRGMRMPFHACLSYLWPIIKPEAKCFKNVLYFDWWSNLLDSSSGSFNVRFMMLHVKAWPPQQTCHTNTKASDSEARIINEYYRLHCFFNSKARESNVWGQIQEELWKSRRKICGSDIQKRQNQARWVGPHGTFEYIRKVPLSAHVTPRWENSLQGKRSDFVTTSHLIVPRQNSSLDNPPPSLAPVSTVQRPRCGLFQTWVYTQKMQEVWAQTLCKFDSILVPISSSQQY